MILVDTSAWIDFFNSPASPTGQLLKELIGQNRPLAINGVIEMEILQGIRSDHLFDVTRKMLQPYQYFPEISKSCLDLATTIFRTCRKKGHTVRKSIDCIIAANALENHLIILHADRDFKTMKKSFKSLELIEA